jgi:hypothetical protein
MGTPSVDQLQREFTHPIIDRAHAHYDTARGVWNAMIDRRPLLIVQPASAHEVARAILAAREYGLPLSIKGGGHSVAGHAVCDDGLVIDLNKMKAVAVDPTARLATVGGGAVLRALDAAAQAHGLATTAGIYRETGVAGLALGGGVGVLMRHFGLTCDNLRSAELVTADGSMLEVCAASHPELFWGVRGGGGNFGVVTNMQLRLHPLTEVYAGRLEFAYDDAEAIGRVYCGPMADAPDELQIYLDYSGGAESRSVSLVICDSAAAGAGEAVVSRFCAAAQPLAADSGPRPYLDVQRFWDDAFPRGQLHFWKSSFLRSITEDALETCREAVLRARLPGCEIALEPMGGAIARIAPDATAFADRNAASTVILISRWTDPAETDERIGWIRETFAALQPFSGPSGYINYMDRGDEERTEAAYSSNYERLRRLKRQYDPENVFRHNANIQP